MSTLDENLIAKYTRMFKQPFQQVDSANECVINGNKCIVYKFSSSYTQYCGVGSFYYMVKVVGKTIRYFTIEYSFDNKFFLCEWEFENERETKHINYGIIESSSIDPTDNLNALIHRLEQILVPLNVTKQKSIKSKNDVVIMNNAFTVLGAEPTDTAERLQELFDEKELLLDDISEAQAAYADLTNPKKRIQHEITYFCSDALNDFNKLVNRAFEETPSLGKIANIVVELGWWFESDDDDLFDRINNARIESGFTQLDDVDIVTNAVQSLKQDCIQAVNAYFDRLKEKSLVGIFNQIVKIDEYESFFIYELMAHYELIIKEQLEQKENRVTTIFNEIEKMCNQFNNGASLSSTLNSKVDEFRTALKEWDNIAQPLQVDMQRRGGQHEDSSNLVYEIRSKIIDLCNRSQEKLGELMESLNDLNNITSFIHNPSAMTASRTQGMSQDRFMAAFDAKRELTKKIPDSLRLTELLIKIIDILRDVFAELEIVSEKLAKDKQDLIELKNALTQWNKPIQEEKAREEQRAIAAEQTSKNCRIAHGVFAAIFFVIMIICFATGSIGAGVAFLLIAGAFGCCCGFYPLLEDRGIMKWIIIVTGIAAILIGVAIGG